MKFVSQLTTVCLATGAYAAALAPRTLQDITGVMSDVQKNVDNLDSAANSFSGDIGPVSSAADQLIATIKAGSAKIVPTETLSLSDALSLMGPVGDLKTHAQKLSTDFTAKRDAVAQAKHCDVARSKLSDINSSTSTLIDDIVGKVPESAQSIARSQTAGITQVLQETQANFAPDKCVNA